MLKKTILAAAAALSLIGAAPAVADAAYLHLDEAWNAAEGRPTPGNSYNDADVVYTCRSLGCWNYERWGYSRVSSTRLCITYRFPGPYGNKFVSYRSYRDGEWKINDAEGC